MNHRAPFNACLSLAVVGSALACWRVPAAGAGEVPGPVTEVRMHRGRPTFFVDGRPFTRPLFQVADPAAEVLAHLAGTAVPTMARNRFDDWASVYTLSAVVTPGIVRAWAREAGVHVYSTADDTLYTSASYLCINAATARERTIAFPRPVDVYNALSDYPFGCAVREVEVSLMAGETVILRCR